MNKPLDDSALKRPMEKLMAKQGVGWIKLQDRKPELGQMCIVFGYYSDMLQYKDVSVYYGRGFMLPQGAQVTHWQPFPIPPTDVEL